jgi:hypothetical protein
MYMPRGRGVIGRCHVESVRAWVHIFDVGSFGIWLAYPEHKVVQCHAPLGE